MSLSLLAHPQELATLVNFQFLGGKDKLFPKLDLANARDSLRRCYEFLDTTSRSFAAVIRALDDRLRNAICLFYLILRGLDTVEDDMSIPNDVKNPLLIGFHEILYKKGWTFNGNGSREKDRQLLVEFDVVIQEFLMLPEKFQLVIKDITMRMGAGMADFSSRHVIDTKKDYDLYCHYVAGLVGIGLSKLFTASGLEDNSVGEDETRANSMGLFLQKTNIIRDYLEDMNEGRTWYPKEVWSKHASNLSDLADPRHRQAALNCLNELVIDALQHVPDVFIYMSRLKNQTVFNFCAIPQVMAIATLSLCFNNGNVFTGVVKIRKGQAVTLMLKSTSMAPLFEIFHSELDYLKSKMTAQDMNQQKLDQILTVIYSKLTEAQAKGLYDPSTIVSKGGILSSVAGQWQALLVVGLVAGFAYHRYAKNSS